MRAGAGWVFVRVMGVARGPLLGAVAVVAVLAAALAAVWSPWRPAGEYPDPQRFAEAIEAFAQADAVNESPSGAVVAVGSSSMRRWDHRIHEDLAPLTVLSRGFGGSNMNDVLHYLEPLVLRYRPRAVLLYEGDNDVALGIDADTIIGLFREVVRRIHEQDATVRIYVVSVKPSISRWSVWPQMQEVNRLLRAEAAVDERLHFVDVATPMLGADGEPMPELFIADDLHMTEAGYDIWRDAVRAVLVKAEAAFE